MKKTRGISEFAFIPFAAGEKAVRSSDFKSIPLDSKSPTTPELHFPSTDDFEEQSFNAPSPRKDVKVLITLPGWLGATNPAEADSNEPFSCIRPGVHGDQFSLLFESTLLQEIGASTTLLNYYTDPLVRRLKGKRGGTAFVHLAQGPLWTHRLSYLLDKPWSIALERAKAAGYLLADAIESRAQGPRPCTLVGFSLGARVAYYCCLELAARGPSCQGLVENVILCGAPVMGTPDEWEALGCVVMGRVVNAHLSNDSLLGLLFRKQMDQWDHVLGLAPVSSPWVHNVALEGV
ncbi:hypothetical protein BC830DRAFT_1073200, partial [Chytriomyces sp. MP71]